MRRREHAPLGAAGGRRLQPERRNGARSLPPVGHQRAGHQRAGHQRAGHQRGDRRCGAGHRGTRRRGGCCCAGHPRAGRPGGGHQRGGPPVRGRLLLRAGPLARAPSRGPPWRGPSARGPPVRGRSSRNPPVRGLLLRGPSSRGPPWRGPSARGPPVRGRSSRNPPVRGLLLRGAPSRGPPVRGRSSPKLLGRELSPREGHQHAGRSCAGCRRGRGPGPAGSCTRPRQKCRATRPGQPGTCRRGTNRACSPVSQPVDCSGPGGCHPGCFVTCLNPGDVGLAHYPGPHPTEAHPTGPHRTGPCSHRRNGPGRCSRRDRDPHRRNGPGLWRHRPRP